MAKSRDQAPEHKLQPDQPEGSREVIDKELARQKAGAGEDEGGVEGLSQQNGSKAGHPA